MRFYLVHDDAFNPGEWDPDVGKLTEYPGKIRFYTVASNPYDLYFERLPYSMVPKRCQILNALIIQISSF